MKSQIEIGRKADEDGHRRGIRACRLTLSLLLVIGCAQLLAGAVTHATPSANPAPQDWQPQIIVRVHNYAQVDAKVLLGGEQIAADILRDAGVDTVWLACSAGKGLPGEPRCARSQTSLDLTLNLETSAKVKQFRLVDDAYGFAAASTNKEFTCDAWVFYDLLKDAALKLQMSTAHLLGNIIAHEFGHLLLAANAHTSWGLMRARWSPEQLLAADRGELDFSNIERAKIRNSVVARHEAQPLAQAQQAPDAASSAAISEIPIAPRDHFLSK
jgi:hypothetical protein